MTKEEVLKIVREELVENLCLHTNIDWYSQTIKIDLTLANGQLDIDIDSEEIDLAPLFSDYLKKDY